MDTKKTLLVVDDEPHILVLIQDELKQDYKFLINRTGKSLLEQIEKEKPDVLILDIVLDDYDGLDLLQDVRDKFYDLPVILYTAYDRYKEEMRSVAADFYVVKSFDLTELKTRIELALKFRKSPSG